MSLIVNVLFVFSFIAALHSAPTEDQSPSSTTPANRQYQSDLGQPGAVSFSSSSSASPVPDSTNRAVRDAQNPNSASTSQGSDSTPNPYRIRGTKPPTAYNQDASRQVRDTVAQAALQTQTPTSAPLTTEASRKTRDTTTDQKPLGTDGGDPNVPSAAAKQPVPTPYSTLPTQDQKQRVVRDTSSTTLSPLKAQEGGRAHQRPAPRPLDPSQVSQRQVRDTLQQKTPDSTSSSSQTYPQVPPVNNGEQQKPTVYNTESVGQRQVRDTQNTQAPAAGNLNKQPEGAYAKHLTTSAPKSGSNQYPASIAGRTVRDADHHEQHPHDQHVASNVHPIPTPTSQKKISGDSRPHPQVHRPEREAPGQIRQQAQQAGKVQTRPAPAYNNRAQARPDGIQTLPAKIN